MTRRRFRFFRAVRWVHAVASHRRSDATDRQLGHLLAFVAGAINAGGFLAIGQYTSHMTGVVSAIADNAALGLFRPMVVGLVMLVGFLAGAAISAILINWGRRNDPARQYALPLLLEALLLIGFALAGSLLGPDQFVGTAIVVLCFLMGLQNATITKISGARVRTTHVTGMVTDIGIEIGKFAYRHGRPAEPGAKPVTGDSAKLRLLATVVGLFLAGGIIGALGFKLAGPGFAAAVSLIPLTLAAPHLVGRRGFAASSR